MSSSDKLLKNTSVYTASSVLNGALPFFLLPILTRLLSPEGYGVVVTFVALSGVASLFVLLSANGAVNVSFFRMNREEYRLYLGNAILVVTGAFLFLLGCLALLSIWYRSVADLPIGWVCVLPLFAYLHAITQLLLANWQAEENAGRFALLQIGGTLLNFALSVTFVVFLKMGWEGRIFGLMGGVLGSALFSIFYLLKSRRIEMRFHRAYASDILRYGIPLIPHSLGGWVIVFSDRVFLNVMSGVEATGVYTVGYMFGMVIGILVDSFNKAWVPYLFRNLKSATSRIKMRLVGVTYAYFFLALIIAALYSFLAPPFMAIFVGDEFQGAGSYVLWVAIGYACNGMYYMVSGYIFYEKKTYLLAWVTFAGAVLNLFLNFILIRANGPIGAAQATALSFFASFVMTWVLSCRIYPMPWAIWRPFGSEED